MDIMEHTLIDEDILTLDIPEIGKSLCMPLNLKVCDQRQYVAICALIYRLEGKEITSEEFKTLSVYELLDLQQGKRKIGEEEVNQALSNIQGIAQYIPNFFFEKEGVLQIKLDYDKNHIEEITSGLHKFYGPQDDFSDVSFGEYEEGLNVFLEYNRVKDIELLVRLAAIFYRKKGKRKREVYDSDTIDERMEQMKYVQPGELYGFYYTFAAFHTYFSSSCVSWEGRVIDMSIVFTEQDEDEKSNYESPYPGLGMKSILFQLAESGVFGNDKGVRRTNLWEVVLRLYDIRKTDLDTLAQRPKEK